jgi:hypothetical protein
MIRREPFPRCPCSGVCFRYSGKNLWTDFKNGEQIGLFQAMDATDEAKHVVEMIQKFSHLHPDVLRSQIAILYRTNAQCESLIWVSSEISPCFPLSSSDEQHESSNKR